jgi:hypothetical protein
MSEHIRVFINERPVGVAAGSDVRAAVRAYDPSLAEQFAAGEAYVTDGRGIEMAGDVLLGPGSILRVVVRARRREGGDADA